MDSDYRINIDPNHGSKFFIGLIKDESMLIQDITR